MCKRVFMLFLILVCMFHAWLDAAETVIQDRPVRIVTSSDPNIFPGNWLSKGIQARAERLPDNQFARSQSVLNRVQKKYPQKVLQKNLKTIYVLHRLIFSGISASGTNWGSNVYLANRGVRAGFSGNRLEKTFHAELSSILLRKYPQYLDKEAWQQVNPKSFKYGQSGVVAVKNQQSGKTFDVLVHARGFLHKYAQSTLENDFNSIAEQLLMGSGSFWRVVDAYPGIKAKTDLTIAFYQHIDPSFSRTFFKSLVNKNRMIRLRSVYQRR